MARPAARAEQVHRVKVFAAAITRDELEWPVDRLPATPSYEFSEVVAAVAGDVHDVDVVVGNAVYALLPFDRDGAAAEYVATPADLLAPKPRRLDHIESAAAALSAWQALFDHGRLENGQRVLIVEAAGVNAPGSLPACSGQVVGGSGRVSRAAFVRAGGEELAAALDIREGSAPPDA